MTRANVKQRAIDASCCCCSVLMDACNLIHHDKPITSSRSLLLLLLFTLFQVGESIRLEHVEVPSVVAVGEPAAFLCNVDLV